MECMSKTFRMGIPCTYLENSSYRHTQIWGSQPPVLFPSPPTPSTGKTEWQFPGHSQQGQWPLTWYGRAGQCRRDGTQSAVVILPKQCQRRLTSPQRGTKQLLRGAESEVCSSGPQSSRHHHGVQCARDSYGKLLGRIKEEAEGRKDHPAVPTPGKGEKEGPHIHTAVSFWGTPGQTGQGWVEAPGNG